MRFCWIALAVLVAGQIAYPLAPGELLVIATVLCGFTLSVSHAVLTRGRRTALLLVGLTGLGGLLVEALGVATGFPFGRYEYTGALGPRLLGVPLVVPLAWTWMAWPAWLAAGRLAKGWARIPVAGLALTAWDLFLDPQLVAAGYWRWDGGPIPHTNYLGWFAVALLMMAGLSHVDSADADDLVMLVLYLWTYYSSVLAHAVFLDLPWSALGGGLVMGTVAVPLSVRLIRTHRR